MRQYIKALIRVNSVLEVLCERGKGGQLIAGNEMSTIVTRCAGPVENTEDSTFIKMLFVPGPPNLAHYVQISW